MGGLKREWERDFRLEVAVEGREVTIRANRAGLVSLAKQLLTMAQEHVPSGCHLHYEAGTALEDDSHDLVIALLK